LLVIISFILIFLWLQFIYFRYHLLFFICN
jgi:hypothetical protein